MYNSKMWLFVKPTVGLPLFFGGVALASLAVHTAVLKNTTWFPAFFNGKNRPPVAAMANPVAVAAVAAPAVDHSPQASLASAQSALVSAQLAIAAAQPALAAIQTNITPPK